MRIFDTYVQKLKYKVLTELARQTWVGNDAFSVFNDIANQVVKKGEPTMSCCIYKDRAIVAERIRIALGGKKEDHNVIQVIDIACDECPVAGHVVTDLCRGCVAHACVDACKLGAITVDSHQKAEIDKSKCVECGKCAKSCPYSAIANFKRPCERACKVDAISMAPDGVAQIDSEKCIECGACVYKCPFGATLDVSSITDIIKTIVDSDNNKNYHVHAIVAPAIAGQFQYAKAGQLISAIRELGFYAVEEVALGADIVAYKEAQELQEKGSLTSSCCPAFVKYIKMKFPQLAEHISHNLSPMAETGKLIKEQDPAAKIVFIGPCTAKKGEVRKPEVHQYVDYVMTFEELQAMIDSKDIAVDQLPETELDTATYYGRVFARTGGLKLKRSPRRCANRRLRQRLQRLMPQTVQALAGLWHPARLELLANRRTVMETAPTVSRSCSTRSSATVSTAAKLPSCVPARACCQTISSRAWSAPTAALAELPA